MTTALQFETYENDPAYPIIWELQESSARDGGLEVLTIPCISKEVAMAEADRRAGRLLDFGKQQGVNQAWEDYGTVPRGRNLVRQVMGARGAHDLPVWQHIRVGFVVTKAGA